MTVSLTINRWDYIGNETPGPYAFTNLVLDASHLKVYVDGVLQTISTHYTVSGIMNPTGGNVTFTYGNYPPSGSAVLLLRVVPIDQLTDYVNHDPFDMEVLEKSFDKLTMICQQLEEKIRRAPKLAVESTISEVEFPSPVSGGYIRWDQEAKKLETVDAEGNIIPPSTPTFITIENIYGGDDAGDNLNLHSTSHSTKGKIYFGSTDHYNESSSKLVVSDILGKGPTVDIRAFMDGQSGRPSFSTWYSNQSTTDVTSVFQAAIDYVGSTLGGVVIVPPTGRYLIDSNLTLKKYVTLKMFVPSLGAANATNTYSSISAIVLNSSATITMQDGSMIDGALIYRKGLTLPASNSSSFAGTAITVSGEGCSVSNSMILGFNKLIYSNGKGRLTVENVRGDGNNGIEINNANDMPRLVNVHLWPFCTYPGGDHKRSGVGFYIRDTTGGDWTRLNGCFSYYYYEGFVIHNSSAVQIVGCGAEHIFGHENSTGFRISGSSNFISLVGCHAEGQDFAGYYLNHTGIHVDLLGCQAWGGSYGVASDNTGNANIIGGCFSNLTAGITINNANNTLIINGVRFKNISAVPIAFLTSNSNVIIGENDYTDFSGNPIGGTGGYPLRSVASSSTVTLPNHGNVFNITGTTNITNISASWAGRKVILKFAGSLTVTDGGNLKLAGNFSATADDTLTLICDGTDWYEVARSAN